MFFLSNFTTISSKCWLSKRLQKCETIKRESSSSRTIYYISLFQHIETVTLSYRTFWILNSTTGNNYVQFLLRSNEVDRITVFFVESVQTPLYLEFSLSRTLLYTMEHKIKTLTS